MQLPQHLKQTFSLSPKISTFNLKRESITDEYSNISFKPFFQFSVNSKQSVLLQKLQQSKSELKQLNQKVNFIIKFEKTVKKNVQILALNQMQFQYLNVE
ncbi:Hypothetical_protein [Hexamita inflata]|uniref:Hypothetical_protein n=1 Tax=Hexamita inflata TaxID=28002 RepID=A0AA86QJ31_9EUKA|nr:Hypothetical protein HINF_LOCUS42157 [Hexamita inflata]